jgi:tRNA(adenine34) deaminase
MVMIVTALPFVLEPAGRNWKRTDKSMSDDFERELLPHNELMRRALEEAQAALAEDEVPIGCVIVHEGRVIASAHNQREQLRDPTAHAEMIAITQAAAALGDWRLAGCTLYVTLEPCAMCAGAMVLSRLPRIIYGARDPKAGAVATLYQLLDDPRLNHRAEVTGGVMAAECGDILTRFFAQKRRDGKK